jgi:predicted kinase
MDQDRPMLHMLCGKIGSGKSTLSRKLGDQPRTVILAEDTWLDALFADQMETVADYLRCSARLRGVMEPHVAALLNAGTSVVLDFPANTVDTRRWMRAILDVSKAAHAMHFLDVPDEVCLDRLHERNAGGDHPFAVTDEQFASISAHFEPPRADEGFNVVRHRPDATQGR